MDALKRLKILTLLLIVRRLCSGALLRDHLTADIVHVLLVILFKFFVHLALDPILKITPRKNPRELFRHPIQDLGDLGIGRRRGEQRILLEDTHEGKHALTAVVRAHERHRVHFARLYDKPFRPHRIREHTKDRGNLCIHARLWCERGRLFRLPVAAE